MVFKTASINAKSDGYLLPKGLFSFDSSIDYVNKVVTIFKLIQK